MYKKFKVRNRVFYKETPYDDYPDHIKYTYKVVSKRIAYLQYGGIKDNLQRINTVNSILKEYSDKKPVWIQRYGQLSVGWMPEAELFLWTKTGILLYGKI